MTPLGYAISILLTLVLLFLVFLSLLPSGPTYNVMYTFTDEPCNKELFTLHLVVPDNSQMEKVASMISDSFAMGCIKLQTHFQFNWTDVNLINKKIPLFQDGGYDIGLFEDTGGLRADVLDKFHSNQINLYNYNNSTLDRWLEEYHKDGKFDTQDVTARKIQDALYIQNPTIAIYDSVDTFAYRWGLSGLEGNRIFAFSAPSGGDSYASLGYSDAPNSSISFSLPSASFDYSPWSITNSAAGKIYQNAIFQGLYQFFTDWDLGIDPLLANDMPTITDNQTKYEVELVPDLTFANGNSVRAEDVYDSFLRYFNPSFQSSDHEDYIQIFGDPINTSSEYYRPLEDIIKIENEQIPTSLAKLSFNLREPHFAALSYLMFPIVDSRVWGAWNNSLVTYDTNSFMENNYQAEIGKSATGPFYYDSINTTTGEVKLARNDDYWDTNAVSATLDFIVTPSKSLALQAFNSQDIDILSSGYNITLSEIENVDNCNFAQTFNYHWQELAVNMIHPIMGTGEETPVGLTNSSKALESAKYVRWAMSHLIPREQIVNSLANSSAIEGTAVWASGLLHKFQALMPFEYSISRAKEYLWKAGYDTQSPITYVEQFHFQGIWMVSINLVIIKIVKTTSRKHPVTR